MYERKCTWLFRLFDSPDCIVLGNEMGILKVCVYLWNRAGGELKTSNLFETFVKGANIVGMMVIAAMSSTCVIIIKTKPDDWRKYR